MDDKELTEHRIEEEKRLASIESTIANVQKDLKELNESVKEMLAAWQAASLVLSFIKGLAALAASIGGVILLIKGGK